MRSCLNRPAPQRDPKDTPESHPYREPEPALHRMEHFSLPSAITPGLSTMKQEHLQSHWVIRLDSLPSLRPCARQRRGIPPRSSRRRPQTARLHPRHHAPSSPKTPTSISSWKGAPSTTVPITTLCIQHTKPGSDPAAGWVAISTTLAELLDLLIYGLRREDRIRSATRSEASP